MNLEKYFNRIKLEGFVKPTSEVLQEIHKNHVFEIPFENLDVYRKKVFSIDTASVYKKVIEGGRGGYCYELNSLLYTFLSEIGFTSRILSARIFTEDGSIGPLFDHMSVYVQTEREYLLDVGFGELFITPLEIRPGVQFDGRHYFNIEKWGEDEFLLQMSSNGIDYQKKYTFNLNPVRIEDFEAMNLDKQTNPESYFVKNLICTKPTAQGRLTIFNQKLVEKVGELREERPILSESHLHELLIEKFDIKI